MWHESKRDEIFDFQREMLKYCSFDVDILRRGCLRFRDVMMKTTIGIYPIDYVTIVGVCMGIFKTLFLKEEHEIEISNLCTNQTTWIPERYVNGDRQVFYNNRWTPLSKLDKHRNPGRKRFVNSPIGMVPPDGYS